MRSFTKKISFALIPYLIMMFTSLVIDPVNLFPQLHPGRFRQTATWLSEGNNVTFSGDLNDRVLEKVVIEEQVVQPEVAVLGSSRILQIGSEIFPGQTLKNHGLTGAVLEDLLALTALYQQKGELPRTLVIGVDPWIFNANNGEQRWRSLSAEVELGLDAIDPATAKAFRLKLASNGTEWQILRLKLYEVLNPRYFLEALQYWREGKSATPTREQFATEKLKLSDGSTRYGEVVRNRTPAETDQLARTYAQEEPIYHLGSFKSIDSEYRALFQAWILGLEERGSRVVLVLSPYHPTMYDVLTTQSEYGRVKEVEEYIRHFAEQQGYQVIGSYDPASLGLNSSSFYDGMHPKRDVFEELF
jgi:hypothetical protein